MKDTGTISAVPARIALVEGAQIIVLYVCALCSCLSFFFDVAKLNIIFQYCNYFLIYFIDYQLVILVFGV